VQRRVWATNGWGRMYFRILGPLMVGSGRHNLPLGGPRQRRILAALLLEPNRPVSMDRLIDVVWGSRSPATAVEQVQNCAGALRRRLQAAGGEARISRRSSAYVLHVDEQQVDAQVFRALLERARTAAAADAAVLLKAAIGLWYGNALDDVMTDSLRGQATWLEELRMQAVHRYAELEIQAGNHGSAVTELTAWIETCPFHEGLCEQLMRALHASGRPAEALAVYRRTRSQLMTELGLEPGEKLRALEQQIIMSTAAPAARVNVPKASLASDAGTEQALRLVQDACSMLVEAVNMLTRRTYSSSRGST
jgi:DNA-binding SARP family transcriptional activator